jgi:hypothetical protein
MRNGHHAPGGQLQSRRGLSGSAHAGNDDDLLDRRHIHDKAMADSVCPVGVNFLPRNKKGALFVRLG